ncbi:MAG: GNAT family N-acetyltransferase [Microlunatus sp.]|nr:GNAT family N-acetyltransferase [Microlunatus sp.]
MSNPVLRPITTEDLPLLTGGESPFDEFGPRPARSEAPRPILTERGGLAIVDDQTAELLGDVSWLWQRWGPNVDSRNPMIGIWLRPQARGRGFGTAAQRCVVDLFFRHTSVNRIEAATDIENLPEQRALERAGFAKEGCVRGSQWRDGAYHDSFLYSILRQDWESHR